MFSFLLAKKYKPCAQPWFILQSLFVAPCLRPLFTGFGPRLNSTVRRPLSLLLMLFLLLTQQASLSHAVSHLAPAAAMASVTSAAQELSSDTQEFAAHACELCIAAAQFAAALPTSTFHLQAADPAAIVHHAVPTRSIEAAPALAFRSRAPPAA